MKSTQFNTKKRAMLDALRKSLGVVTRAAEVTGIDRTTHYKWCEADPKYKDAVEAMNEVALDFAESKLHELIRDKNCASVIFYLKTRGKKRGYIETRELTLSEAPKLPTWFTEMDSE